MRSYPSYAAVQPNSEGKRNNPPPPWVVIFRKDYLKFWIERHQKNYRTNLVTQFTLCHQRNLDRFFKESHLKQLGIKQIGGAS